MNSNDCEVSVVAPVLNEQDSIEPLYRQITETLAGKYEYEIIFVDGRQQHGSELPAGFQARERVSSFPEVQMIKANGHFQ